MKKVMLLSTIFIFFVLLFANSTTVYAEIKYDDINGDGWEEYLNTGEEITSVVLGFHCASAITSEGRIFTWGYNSNGQLGDGTIIDRDMPTDITPLFGLDIGETITSVSLGKIHSSAITSENRVFTWGYNYYGQLGDGTTTDSYTPIEITANFGLIGEETVIIISLGERHSSAVTSEGRILTWGGNNYGQLGDGTIIDQVMPTEITTNFGLIPGETVTSVSLGYLHSSAITSTGRIFTWGYNYYGQLGDGTQVRRYNPTDITTNFGLSLGETITNVTLGKLYYSSAMTSTGRVFTWGGNYHGELGDGTRIDRYTPTDITTNFGLTTGETVTSIDLGEEHSSAVTSTGRIFTWGENNGGQLGDGTTIDKYIPMDITNNMELNTGETVTSVSSGDGYQAAITSKGRLFTWGANWFGQLGDGTIIFRYDPNDITTKFGLITGETVTTVSLGNYHSSAITSKGRVFTWGDNDYGQLGDGTTTDRHSPTEITTNFVLNAGEAITDVFIGAYHSCAITSNGRIFTWGYNSYGQLGNGTTTSGSIPADITTNFGLDTGEKITSVALGNLHSSAVTSEGRLFTWGYNSASQLGDGTTISRYTPTNITANFGIIGNETITSVSLGFNHSSAITSEGRLFTWGSNQRGQLGVGTFTNKNIPTDITANLSLVNDETVTSISLGDYHSSAITSEGRLFTWGFNSSGQLGDGTIIGKSSPMDITNEFGLSVGEMITGVSLGTYHSCAITSNSRMFSWGGNASGQLGDGTTTDTHTPMDISSNFVLNDAETVKSGSLGKVHSSVITSEGRFFTWGANGFGQLGDGTVIDRLTPMEVILPITYGDVSFIYTISYQLNYNAFDDSIDVQLLLDFPENLIGAVINGTYTTIESYYNNIAEFTLYDNLVTFGENYNINITQLVYTGDVYIDSTGYNQKLSLLVDYEEPTFVLTDQTIEAGAYMTLEPLITNIVENSNDNLIYSEPATQMDYDTPGVYTVTVRLSDLSENYTEEVVTITVEDNTVPTFTITDQTIEAGAYTSLKPLITNIVENSDDELVCNEQGLIMDYDTLGVYTVTVRLSDQSGNYSEEVVTITVEDNTAPTFTTSNQTIESGAYINIDWTTYITNVSDNSDGVLTSSEIEDNVDYNTPGIYIINVKVVDESLNEISHTFNVTVEDTTAPAFTITDQTIEIYIATIDWTTYITDQIDNSDGVLTSFEILTNVDYDNLGTYTVTVKLVDESLNESTQTINVTVRDTTAPIITLIGDSIIYVECSGTYTELSANFTDNYDTTSAVVVAGDIVNSSVLGTYTVTYNVIDSEGNAAIEVTRSVVVEDTTAPTFYIDDLTIEAGAYTSLEPLFTNIVENSDSELVYSEPGLKVDYDTPGTYTLPVRLTDQSGNYSEMYISITVVDTTAPTFTITTETIEAGIADIDWTTYITNQTDNSDGVLTSSENVDNIDYNIPGTYTVTVNLVDESLNETSQTFNVIVEDTTPPAFTITDQTIEAGTVNIDWTTYITNQTDNIDGVLTSSENVDNVDYNTPGTYSVTVTLVDESFNETSYTFNVTVEDTVGPEVSINPSLDSIEVGSVYTEYGVTAIDVTETSVSIEGTVDTNTPGVYVITYDVTDELDNITTIERYVTVYGKEPIVEFILSEAYTTIKLNEQYTDGSCTVIINGTEYQCIVKDNNIDTSYIGVYTITYAYTYNDIEYTYQRYVFVASNEGYSLLMYLPDGYNRKEGDVEL